tara:strand:+ start:505 stop:705 length:201 start_codon:yes stop_codon:yes gene_type:complete
VTLEQWTERHKKVELGKYNITTTEYDNNDTIKVIIRKNEEVLLTLRLESDEIAAVITLLEDSIYER